MDGGGLKQNLKQEINLLMKGITKVYPNGLVANSDVTFEVRKGRFMHL